MERWREKEVDTELGRSRQQRRRGRWAKVRKWDETDGSEKRGKQAKEKGRGQSQRGRRGGVSERQRCEQKNRRVNWIKLRNLRFESCVLQSELFQTVGLADCVENLVHHLRPLETDRTRHRLVTGAFHLKRKKNGASGSLFDLRNTCVFGE